LSEDVQLHNFNSVVIEAIVRLKYMNRANEHRISFCVVCMNRLHQLRETLLRNLDDNKNYDNLEFIVLDYNSSDGMEEWAKENLKKFILSGRLKYYKTKIPFEFNHSHSKNIAFKLATGKIICNINADHFTGFGFAKYVNRSFNLMNDIVLTTIDFPKTKHSYRPPKDVFGKVCVKKEDFLKVKGFDERMKGYGFEDWDFINRLEFTGVKRLLIENFSYLKFISHEEEERYSLNVQELKSLYVHYLSPSKAELILLYKNRNYKKGVIIDNSTLNSDDLKFSYTPRDYLFEYSIEEPGWELGEWEEDEFYLHFFSKKKSTSMNKSNYNDNAVIKNGNSNVYYMLRDNVIIANLFAFDNDYENRLIMEKNLRSKLITTNKFGFGEAILYKNFNNLPFSI